MPELGQLEATIARCSMRARRWRSTESLRGRMVADWQSNEQFYDVAEDQKTAASMACSTMTSRRRRW